MPYKTYVPMRKPAAPARVTIQPGGAIWVSSKTKRMFGNYKRVFLRFDEERKLIGLQPTRERKNTFSLSCTKGRNDASISGISFFKYFGINVKKTTSYESMFNEEEKLVEIDLKKPLPRV